jgi:hypothetical protein
MSLGGTTSQHPVPLENTQKRVDPGRWERGYLQSRSQTQTRMLFLVSRRRFAYGTLPHYLHRPYAALHLQEAAATAFSFPGVPASFFHSTLPDYLHRPYIGGDSYHVFVPEF